MKSHIIKLIAIIAIFIIGGFVSSAQNNETALSSDNSPVSSSTAFAIDKNIISVDVNNLVDKVIHEYAPYPNPDKPEPKRGKMPYINITAPV
jgi:hypothetical protein